MTRITKGRQFSISANEQGPMKLVYLTAIIGGIGLDCSLQVSSSFAWESNHEPRVGYLWAPPPSRDVQMLQGGGAN